VRIVPVDGINAESLGNPGLSGFWFCFTSLHFSILVPVASIAVDEDMLRSIPVTDKTAARAIRRCNSFMDKYFIVPLCSEGVSEKCHRILLAELVTQKFALLGVTWTLATGEESEITSTCSSDFMSSRLRMFVGIRIRLDASKARSPSSLAMSVIERRSNCQVKRFFGVQPKSCIASTIEIRPPSSFMIFVD
jgi:hypothetical protein